MEWLGRGGGKVCDDLLVTVGGDGDPLLYGGLVEVLRGVRGAGALSVCVVTDLVSGVERLVEAIEAGLVDVVSVMMYGHTAETYGRVARRRSGGGDAWGNDEECGAAGGGGECAGGDAAGGAAVVEGAGDDSGIGGVFWFVGGAVRGGGD